MCSFLDVTKGNALGNLSNPANLDKLADEHGVSIQESGAHFNT